jgi:hypothetical protein
MLALARAIAGDDIVLIIAVEVHFERPVPALSLATASPRSPARRSRLQAPRRVLVCVMARKTLRLRRVLLGRSRRNDPACGREWVTIGTAGGLVGYF